VAGHAAGEGLCFGAVAHRTNQGQVGEAFDGVFDLMGQVFCYRRRGNGDGVLQESVLLALVAERKRTEVGEDLHHTEVFAVEGFGAAVGENPDGAALAFGLPREKDAVGDEGSVDLHDVEEEL